MFGQLLCRGDVAGLRSLVAATEQYHQAFAASLEIDAVAWAVVDSQLAYAFADRLDIAGQSMCQTRQSCCDHGSGAFVSEVSFPLHEGVGLLDFNHKLIVV